MPTPIPTPSSLATATVHTLAELPIDRPMPKLDRQRIIGQRMMLSRVILHEGFVLERHQHENEQFVVMLSGRCVFTIDRPSIGDAQEIELRAGQVLLLPSYVPHAVRALERSEILDFFSPVSATTGVDRKE